MSRSIIVVDDDDDTRAMVEMILVNRGYKVECCSSGQDALDRLAIAKPAIMLLDVMMPGLSGYDVLERMKQKPETKNIPVIMLTAKSQGDEMIEGYQQGADYYITKPFTTEQLIYGITLFIGETKSR